jgi:hypothetical protein
MGGKSGGARPGQPRTVPMRTAGGQPTLPWMQQRQRPVPAWYGNPSLPWGRRPPQQPPPWDLSQGRPPMPQGGPPQGMQPTPMPQGGPPQGAGIMGFGAQSAPPPPQFAMPRPTAPGMPRPGGTMQRPVYGQPSFGAGGVADWRQRMRAMPGKPPPPPPPPKPKIPTNDAAQRQLEEQARGSRHEGGGYFDAQPFQRTGANTATIGGVKHRYVEPHGDPSWEGYSEGGWRRVGPSPGDDAP